jgi:hypothetical protein
MAMVAVVHSHREVNFFGSLNVMKAFLQQVCVLRIL